MAVWVIAVGMALALVGALGLCMNEIVARTPRGDNRDPKRLWLS